MTFQEASYEAARRFLQTIVIVDNQAGYLSPPEPAQAVELVVPDVLDTTGEDDRETNANPSDAPLNAMAISEAFASQGLICSILKPTPENALSEAAIAASERADVLVLDWEMADSGQLATGIARSLLAKDHSEGGKLRLIAVYTGRAPLRDVRAAFKTHYDALDRVDVAAGLGAAPSILLSKAGLTISAAHARIIFLSKNAPPAHGGAEAQLSVSEEDLPKRLLTEFAHFAGGLLPNATLATIAELRRRTHRMLARFDKTLDGPILTNRALTQHKEESEEIAANLILAELEGQVPLSHIAREFMGAESVREYLSYKMANGLVPSFMKDSVGNNLQAVDLDQACNLIEQGLSAFDDATLDAHAQSIAVEPDKYRTNVAAGFHKRLYALLGDVKSGRAAHERFAVVSMMRRDITGVDTWTVSNRPAMKLGTIISASDNYWICLTPICDCVRLDSGKAALLFTQLHKDNSTFEIVVPKDASGKTVAKLRTKPKAMQLVTMNFANVEKGMVRAKIKGAAAVFEAWPLNADRAAMTEFAWVGELKPMQAQRLIQNFAANLARVGLDENEWHRLQT